jgi:outer membrane protein assembly factor BamB
MIRFHRSFMTTIWINKRRLTILLGLLILTAALTGCSGNILGNANWPGISVDEANVFIALGQYVYAVDKERGDEVCRFPEEPQRGNNFFAPPLVVNEELVVAGDFHGTVYGLDSTQDCEELWNVELSDDFIIGGPVLNDDTVLVPSADGTLYDLEFDTNSAEVRWDFPTESALWSSPLVSGGVIFQSSMDHHVYALDATDGSLIWKADLGAAVLDTPSETEDLLLVGTFGNELVALDKSRGGVEWRFETGAWVWGNPLVIGDNAYFGDLDGNIYVLDVRSGREVWDADKLDGAVASTPATSGELVYFATGTGSLFARTISDFTPEWEESLDGGLYISPLVEENTLILSVISQDAPLVVLEADTSRKSWAWAPAEE